MKTLRNSIFILTAILLLLALVFTACTEKPRPGFVFDYDFDSLEVVEVPGQTVIGKVPVNSYPDTNMAGVTQEIVLTSTANYAHPYLEASIYAVFTGPEGQKMTVPGYFFGGKTWKVRFAAPSEGTWNYEVFCDNTADAGLHGIKGTLTANAYTGDNELIKHGRPRVSNDKEDLTYADGTPFFWLADTHWWGFSKRLNLDRSNSPDYEKMFYGTIDQRAAEGYTAFQAMLWVSNDSLSASNSEDGAQWQSIWKDPTPAYWRNIDRRIDYIVSKGIVPVIGFDWGGALTTQNFDRYKQIVRYVIARYASYPVVWNMAGEYTTNAADLEALENYGRLGQYVSDIDAYGNLETIHNPYYDYFSADYFRGQEWFDFVMSEGGHSPTFHLYDNGSGMHSFYKEYKLYNERGYKLPWLEAEAKYEDIWEIPTDQTREIAYLAIMNGSFGYSYGVEGGWQDTWDVNDDFQTYWRKPTPWYVGLNKIVGTTQMPYMKEFFMSLPYWDLEPDYTSVKWTAEPDNDMVLRPTVNSTSDKRCIIIYYPMDNKSINYDVFPEARDSILSGLDKNETYTAMWFDTKTGVYRLISDSVTPSSEGTLVLPWPEHLDTNDCVFVLKANSAPEIDEEYRLAAEAERNAAEYERR